MQFSRRGALGLFLPAAPAIIGLAKPSFAQMLTTGAGKKPGGAAPTAFTWNPADAGPNSVFASSNRDYAPASAGAWTSVRSILSKTTGLWYSEISVPTAVAASTPNAAIGLAKSDFVINSYLGSTDTSSGDIFAFPGSTFNSSSMVNVTAAPTTDTVTAGDVYQMWWNLGVGAAWLGKNGSAFPGMNPVAGTGPWVTWTPGGAWFVAATQNSNSTCTLRLAASTSFAPGGSFAVLNA